MLMFTKQIFKRLKKICHKVNNLKLSVHFVI